MKVGAEMQLGHGCWIIIACIWVTCAAAESSPFAAYAVMVQPASAHAPIALNDPKSRQYANELKSAAGQDVNFAGHYILAIWRCGAFCVMGAAIDANTGKVAWLPFTVCCWSRDVMKPLNFKANSRLLLVNGSRNEKGAGKHAYVFDGYAFTLLPSSGHAAHR